MGDRLRGGLRPNQQTNRQPVQNRRGHGKAPPQQHLRQDRSFDQGGVGSLRLQTQTPSDRSRLTSSRRGKRPKANVTSGLRDFDERFMLDFSVERFDALPSTELTSGRSLGNLKGCLELRGVWG